MNLTNFRFDTDADGIATAVWDRPGRSMNVINLEVIDELSRIIEAVASDAAIKGCVVTSGKEAFSASAARDLRQAFRGGDPRRLPRRRLRARARLPSPGRVRR